MSQSRPAVTRLPRDASQNGRPDAPIRASRQPCSTICCTGWLSVCLSAASLAQAESFFTSILQHSVVSKATVLEVYIQNICFAVRKRILVKCEGPASFGWALPQRQAEKLCRTGGDGSRAAAPPEEPDASLVRCSGHVPPVGRPRDDPGHAGGTMSLDWPGNAPGSPRKSWMKWPERGKPGLPCSGCCPVSRRRISGGRWMDGWMDGWI